jgi:hypothetical protein
MDGVDPAAARYVIRIRGHLGPAASSAFPELLSRYDGADTVLVGDLDQAALHGVLSEIATLSLDLVEVRQITPGPDQGMHP